MYNIPVEPITVHVPPYRLPSVARLSFPVALLILIALGMADLRTAYHFPAVLMGLNGGFLVLLPLVTTYFAARHFLVYRSPALLMWGGATGLYAAAGLSTTFLSLTTTGEFHFILNQQDALRTILTWMAAIGYVVGAAFSLNWKGFVLPAPRWWLVGTGLVILSMIGLTIFVILFNWTPLVLDSTGKATPIGQIVDGSSILMLVFTAIILQQGNQEHPSPVIAWLTRALYLFATGMFGVQLQHPQDSIVGWVSQVILYLGCGFMLVAMLLNKGRGPAPRVIPATRKTALHAYGAAVTIVLIATVIRLVFLQSFGVTAPYLQFYPAVILVALYAGFRAGLLATVLSLVLTNYFWDNSFEPGDIVQIISLLRSLAFGLSALLLTWAVARMQRIFTRLQSSEIELQKSELKQAQLIRSLRLLNSGNAAVGRASSEQELFDDLCRFTVEIGHYAMAWVGVPEPGAFKCVRPVAQFGNGQNYLQSIHSSWDADDNWGQGMTGKAIRTGLPQVNQSYLTNPAMAPWRDAALACGYQTSAAFPLVVDKQVIGVLALCSTNANTFTKDEIALVEEFVSSIAYGLHMLRARCELERYQQQLEERVVRRTHEIAALNTDLRAKVKDAEAANQAKSTFLATMSHEMRTPLSAVVGLAELLADSPLDRRQRDCADQLQLSAETLRTLIDDVLDFSKIEVGALQLEQAPFSLHTIMCTMAAVIASGIRDKSIEALFDFPLDLPDMLIGDATRLKQILLNLISNAVKFTDQGDIVITVRPLAQEAGWVTLQFQIRDSGIGIPEEQLGRIFDAFCQAEAGTTRLYGGTGLGLAISARLAKLMNSDIEVTSRPHQGSEFSFTMTLARADGAPAAPLLDDLSGLSVLIIDDHPVARDLLRQSCVAFGWQATALASAAAGLDELQRCGAEGRDYDLMLLDWRMPDMDGIKMLHTAKAIRGINLPRVILMAPTFELQGAILASAGLYLDGFLAKPITPVSLMEAVTRAHVGDFCPLQPPNVDNRLQGMRFLVAEDNAINQYVLKEMLTRAGAEIVMVADGRAAVDTLRLADARFDAVLMDLQMPVMNGYTATRIIRDELGLVDLPIIALTAFAQAEDHEKSRRAGMVGHLVKSVNIRDLLDILGREQRKGERRRAPVDDRGAGMPLPILPGVDVAVALQTFGGNQQKYLDLLRQFMASHAGDAMAARRLLDVKDISGAAKLIHDLRGIAGLLQATTVGRLAAAVEHALRNGPQQAALPLFDELHNAIQMLAIAVAQTRVERRRVAAK